MNTIQLIELLGIVPIVGSIVGIWVKMNTLISKQEIKIENLEQELKEMKRHNERNEEKLANKLDEIDKKLTDFMLHVGKCRNFKID